ncbi:acyl-CoA thioesterase [Wenzhouxiangella sp. EGI_FJ10409]|uniref:acyl-CoA thioesterase n=1 Tax=Wenzhouxiangella sp. EGI_FJ10409 TaxID=3243767 RepID=UPI0035D6CE14
MGNSIQIDAFPYIARIPTRWRDNDVYGHVNNVVYYSFFDTAVNTHLIEEGGLDIHHAPVIGVVVETRCEFKKELTFPGMVQAGIRVTKLGRSSVTYQIALFAEDGGEPAAIGHFVHVYIDRESRRPVPIPDTIRVALESIMTNE